jgi:metal-responsive CopG/Arc/MetJ family transcriptional regulator
MKSSDPAADGLDDPAALGMESRNEAVRRLVRMVVREEIRVRR